MSSSRDLGCSVPEVAILNLSGAHFIRCNSDNRVPNKPTFWIKDKDWAKW